MKKLKDLGFKKVAGTSPGFHMYELNPAELGARQRIHDNLKAEAASDKPQAASNKRLDKVKQIQDNRGYKQKEKYGKHYKTNTTNE